MKAVMYYGPKEIRIERVPVPRPGPGEVLLKVGAALTCGTDFKAYRQGHKVLLRELPSPFGPGLAGTVVSAGEGGEVFPPGTRVVAANSAPCDHCPFCRRGQPQLCEDLRLHNGAYAEYSLLPARIVRHNLHAIPATMDFRTAAVTEPLACAVHAADAVGVLPGDTAAILGAGIMSMLLVSALKQRGARVIVVGRSPQPLERALAVGADFAFSALKGDPVETVRNLTDGLGADCAFEAVGRPETWQQSIEMARKGGKVCLFGGCAQGTRVPVDAHRVHYSQLTLFGVFHHTPKYFAQALSMLSDGRVDARLLVDGEIPLDEVPGYFQRMHERSNAKVAVIP